MMNRSVPSHAEGAAPATLMILVSTVQALRRLAVLAALVVDVPTEPVEVPPGEVEDFDTSSGNTSGSPAGSFELTRTALVLSFVSGKAAGLVTAKFCSASRTGPLVSGSFSHLTVS